MIKPSEVLTEMMETMQECKASLDLANRPYNEASLVHLMTVTLTLRHIDSTCEKIIGSLEVKLNEAIRELKGEPT